MTYYVIYRQEYGIDGFGNLYLTGIGEDRFIVEKEEIAKDYCSKNSEFGYREEELELL